MFNRTIMYAKLAWVYAKESLLMRRKFRWIDLALLPFGLCLQPVGAGHCPGIVRLGSLWNSCLQDDGVIFDVVAGTICSLADLWYRIRVCFHQNAAALSSAIQCCV